MILKIDNDNFPKQHQECGQCYGILCSLWGTNWIWSNRLLLWITCLKQTSLCKIAERSRN